MNVKFNKMVGKDRTWGVTIIGTKRYSKQYPLSQFKLFGGHDILCEQGCDDSHPY